MASIPGTINTAQNLTQSVGTIPEKSQQVSWVSKIFSTNPYEFLRNQVSTPLTNGTVYCIKSTGLLNKTASHISESCAKRLYNHYCSKTTSFYAEKAYDHFMGSWGAPLKEVAGFFASWGEEQLIRKYSEQVFLPVVTILTEVAYKNAIQSGLNIAIDSGILYATGSFEGITDYKDIEKVIAVADKISTMAQLGALTYVYGAPTYHGVKLAVQCASLNARKNQIKTSLENAGVSEPLKTTASVILMICIDSVALCGLDLNRILSDQKVVEKLCQAASISIKLTS